MMSLCATLARTGAAIPAAALVFLALFGSHAQASTPQIVQVAPGEVHSCALDNAGRVWCWGGNASGQLGTGTATQRERPTPALVEGVENAMQIASGRWFSCALLGDRTVRCWGAGGNGELGNGTRTGGPGPVAVAGLTGVAQISLGNAHGCALLQNGTVRCWGSASHGGLGIPDNTYTSLTPAPPIPGLSDVVQIALGWSHGCARLRNGELRCWGDALALGNNDPTTHSPTPVSVRGITTAAGIAGGYRHHCARLTDGLARCWGSAGHGQLGNGSPWSSWVPVGVAGLTGATALSLGHSHSCALRSDRTMHCWGRNGNGQLGDGTTTHRNRPVAVQGLGPVASIGLGHWHSCAALTDGSLRCWGWNNRGQLGDGTTTDRATPVTVSFPAITVSPTQTLLTGPDSGVLGQTVSLTATVTSASGTPAGNVSFRNAGTQFATATLNAQGVAMINTSALPLGSNQITARYLGSASHRASTSAVLPVTIRDAPLGFAGGGAVFGQSQACAPVLGLQAHGVALRYSPSELGGLPSGLTLAWPEGSEHLTLWGAMAPSGAFLGGSGRQSWTRFVFYQRRPLIRVVARQVTRPAGAALAQAEELVLRLRVQNFAARPGCSVTVAGTLRRE